MTEAPIIYKTRDSAIMPRDPSAIGRRPRPEASVSARKPLGLKPIIDDEPASGRTPDNMTDDGRVVLHDGYSFSFADEMSPEFLAAPITGEFLCFCMNALIGTDDTTMQKAKELVAGLRKEFEDKLAGGAVRELQLERERDRATIAEMRAKLGELDFVVERLKVENRGPPGVEGPRGRDGADGARGPRGERGERGPAGPRLIGWENDDAQFAATPLMSDGRKGATLHLRGAFEQYHGQVEGEAAAEEADAAAASRATVERDAEMRRQGR
jgi:hypothetical protein